VIAIAPQKMPRRAPIRGRRRRSGPCIALDSKCPFRSMRALNVRGTRHAPVPTPLCQLRAVRANAQRTYWISGKMAAVASRSHSSSCFQKEGAGRRSGSPPRRPRPTSGFALFGLHAIHGVDREIRVGIGATRAHFASKPYCFHHFLLRGAFPQRALGVAADAIGALRHMATATAISSLVLLGSAPSANTRSPKVLKAA
jgi:hypothetical protein